MHNKVYLILLIFIHPTNSNCEIHSLLVLLPNTKNNTSTYDNGLWSEQRYAVANSGKEGVYMMMLIDVRYGSTAFRGLHNIAEFVSIFSL
jgi:hypothetical protein